MCSDHGVVVDLFVGNLFFFFFACLDLVYLISSAIVESVVTLRLLFFLAVTLFKFFLTHFQFSQNKIHWFVPLHDRSYKH